MEAREFPEMRQRVCRDWKTLGISTFIGKGEAKDEEVGEVTERPGKAGDTGSMDEREEGAK